MSCSRGRVSRKQRRSGRVNQVGGTSSTISYGSLRCSSNSMRVGPCFERAVTFWAGLERSFLLRIASVHVAAFYARARAALAEAQTAKNKAAALVRSARADAMRFARDRARYAAPTANLILAGADTVEGKTEAGLAHLEKAIAGFVAAEMG